MFLSYKTAGISGDFGHPYFSGIKYTIFKAAFQINGHFFLQILKSGFHILEVFPIVTDSPHIKISSIVKHHLDQLGIRNIRIGAGRRARQRSIFQNFCFCFCDIKGIFRNFPYLSQKIGVKSGCRLRIKTCLFSVAVSCCFSSFSALSADGTAFASPSGVSSTGFGAASGADAV